MGKDLKGKELGTGLRQRKDGRYEARAKINGIDINLYDVDLKKLKVLFEKAKDGLPVFAGRSFCVIISPVLQEGRRTLWNCKLPPAIVFWTSCGDLTSSA